MGRKPKLTPHQQHEAIKRRDAGEPVREIARSYAVSHSTISRLVERGGQVVSFPTRNKVGDPLAVEHIHTYLVHPGKDSQTTRSLGGASVPLTGKLFDLLSDIYARADTSAT